MRQIPTIFHRNLVSHAASCKARGRLQKKQKKHGSSARKIWSVRDNADVCSLRSCPYCGLRTPIPDVTGGEPLPEQPFLDIVTFGLVQGAKVPEHGNVLRRSVDLVLLEVPFQEAAHDGQMEFVRVGVTCRNGVSGRNPLLTFEVARSPVSVGYSRKPNHPGGEPCFCKHRLFAREA